MVSKGTKILVGIVVVALVLVCLITIAGSDDSYEARYNYKVELTDSFEWKGDSGTVYTQKANDGKQYAILTYTVFNDSYDDGVSTNPLTWVWKIVANNIEYTDSADTFLHPGYLLVDVAEGGHATQVLVFQIPDTLSNIDISVTEDYIWTFDPPKFQLDETIVV